MIKKFLKRRKKGGTTFWATGMFAITFSLIIGFLVISLETLENIKYDIEDSLSCSALAGALVDKDRYSITGDVFIQDYIQSFETFKRFYAYNERLQPFINGTSNAEDNIACPSGKHPYYDFTEGRAVRIKRYIIYNIPSRPNASGEYWGEKYEWNGEAETWYTTQITSISPGINYGNLNDDCKVQTPFGDNVTKSGIYVELELPINLQYFHIKTPPDKPVIKSELIYIESNIPDSEKQIIH